MIFLKKIINITFFISLLFVSLSSQAGLISGDKWGDSALGTSGGEVTWSIMDDGISCFGTFEPTPCTTTSLSNFMPSDFISELERAFSLWSSIADIAFTLITDGGENFGAPSASDIRLAGHVLDGPSDQLAHGYFPTISNTGGDIHFDITENWSTTGDFIDVFSVAVHEIGHAIGIDHSLTTDAVMYSQYNGPITDLHADDIATAQLIYGPSLTVSVPEPSSLILFMSMIGFILVKKRQLK